MKEIQPEVKKIQDKYKNDPQKLNEATMKLYKENGANPFSGCLPLLIQYPVLIAMFYVFRSAQYNSSHSFLWIKNLAAKDSIYDFTYIDRCNFIHIYDLYNKANSSSKRIRTEHDNNEYSYV